MNIFYINIFLITIILTTSSCSNDKPAPYVDKSHTIYSKKGIDSYNNSVYPMVTQPHQIVDEAYNNSNNDIIENKLTDLQSDHSHYTNPKDEVKALSSNSTPLHNKDEYLTADSINKETNLGKTSDSNSLMSEIENTPNSISNVGLGTYKISYPLGNNKFEWPLEGKILNRFGKTGNKFNEGMNISAPLGTPVVAIGDGKVVYIGNNVEGYGNLLIIRHDKDLMSAYAHLKDIVVERNATIKKGESIGSVGQVGNVNQPQLHFSIRKGKKTIDPEVLSN